MTNADSEAQTLGQMMVGSWITQGIYAVAELGIPDLLMDGPQPAEILAAKTDTNADALYRVLRAVSSLGVLCEDDEGRFTLTSMGERLCTEAPGRQRQFAMMSGAEFYQAWGGLLSAVRSGREAAREVFGKSWFEYLTAYPDRHAIFDAAMTGIHGPETEPMLDAYDFSTFETIVDVGGGNGLTLAAILKRHRELKGVLFELPSVAERARVELADAEVSDRLQIAGGDFFSTVPRGADAYIMRHVLHDWPDEKAAAILRNCCKAMRPDGRVLVVETVIPRGGQPCFGKWLDLMMLIVGGRERTEAEFRNLFSLAGLELTRIVPTSHEVSVIEGVRVGSCSIEGMVDGTGHRT